MKLYFIGADREVTGSCHVIENGGRYIMLDCGMEQGRYEYMLKNDAVWIDLAGNRPVLRKLQVPCR